jgi:tetratricopeptide (TPR) repeat protein
LNRIGANKYLRNFLDKDPNCEEAHLGLSQIYFSLGIHDKALHHISKAIERNPHEAYYLSLRAFYLYTIKQWNKNVSFAK